MNKKQHNCVNLPEALNDSEEGKICIANEEGNWYLAISSFADKEMVEDGEAEEVGEDVWSYEIKIDFCPFCGKSLKELVSQAL